MKLKKIQYKHLSSKQKEIYNFQKVAAILADYGFNCIKLADDLLDMLNDPRPRSRNQIVLNALRSRHIAGNKTNRSSMNATVSRLKSAGIAEDHGKKVRLAQAFLTDWGKIAVET